MGRSGKTGADASGSVNGGVRGGAQGSGAAVSKKVIGGITAVLLAVICSAFGLQGTSGSGSDASATATTTASSTSGQRQEDASASSDQVGTLTFRSEERLQSHYEKHGVQMGFSSAEDYLAAANAVVSNPEALHKLESEDGDDVYYLESTGEFVVVSQKGYIRTYYLADKDYYDRQ
ncbi:MAG: hypothetical protein Q4B45_07115 [Coriobacteriia bacterium]|nr:hypothetical protein [Coriobacteriia bacterium]